MVMGLYWGVCVKLQYDFLRISIDLDGSIQLVMWHVFFLLRHRYVIIT